MTNNPLAVRDGLLLVVAAMAFPAATAAKDPVVVPDFTQGAKIPPGAKHDWNLGPTGLRGWIYCEKLVTTDARQILVTKVDTGSPAADSFQIGDVILGVGGKAFTFDPRTELGKAITAAESKAGAGKLALTRWRAGKTSEVVLELPVLGDYAATVPFACDKSKRLLEDGCKALAARMAKPGYAEMDAIPRSLNALALLASGNAEYLPLVKKEAGWAAGFSVTSMQTWYYGYCSLFLSEYVLATGDESVLPGLKRLAVAAAKGQSAVGSWGHGFAIPDGRLGGYGMMNSPGVVLTIGLVLAREAGVKDAEVSVAIERSAKLLRFYTGKGAIPYGDHSPWMEGHEDNGKCGMAAVLFNALGEAKAAEFFARMSVAAHGPERDCGHCGNYFNLLWAMPSVALSGPNATGAWMTEFGTWYFDLARRWDGGYPHQGPPENEEDSFEGFDATGTYLLAYAMPLKKTRLTGAGKSVVKQLDAAGAESLIADGRGWDNKVRHSAYDKLSGEQLVERLGSWSPVVRERAAMAMARRKEAPVPALLKLLDSPSLDPRYGACQALAALGKRGEPAVPSLQKCLTDKDLWLRINAAKALAKIGPSAKFAVPKLLEMLAEVDKVNDPRGMQQRYLTFALFDRGDGGMLRGSLDGIDREALYKAVRAGLKNEDGRARSSLSSVYGKLSLEEIKPLLPAIYQAINEPAPSGEMFADGIRVEGLRLFAKHRIEDGIPACVKYTREQNPWDSQERTPELMKILLSYGTHAKAVIPELTKLAHYFEKDEPDFPKALMKQKAKSVRDTIRAIEASTETPDLIKLDKEPKADPAKAPEKPVAGKVATLSEGLHGYISFEHEPLPAKGDYSAGMGFYSAVWPLADKPLADFQIGLPSAWIQPNNSDNKDKPLAPKGTLARTWKERGPTWDSVFQTVEGGLGYWAGNHFRYGPPKFSMNATPQCYDYEVGSPGWSFFYSNEALPDDRLGIAQLSNRLLIPPDALPFQGNPNGEFLGYSWMALPFTDATKGDPPTGDQSWTCFLNAGNFKGPIAYYIPETWSKMGKLFKYPFINGRGLDTRPGVMGGGAMEINTVPRLEAADKGGVIYSKIPKLQFPVDDKGRAALVQDVTYYSKAALYDAFKTWRDGGKESSGKFDDKGAFRPKLTTKRTKYDQAGKPIAGVEKAFDTKVFEGNVWGLQWSKADLCPKGQFPQYFKQVGKVRVAVPEADVPAETNLLAADFRLATAGEPYTSPSVGAWAKPGPKDGPYTVVLVDGSEVTYSWYRFVDQPSFQQYGWDDMKKEKLQSLVEKLHASWGIDRDYMAPPTRGKLVSLDPALLVTPPKGLEVGYVPIVTRQAKPQVK